MSDFIELKCPRCSSAQYTPIDRSHYRCAHCQATFVRNASAPWQPLAQALAVGELSGYARRSVLNPGEDTPILALGMNPPAFTRVDVKATDPEAQSYEMNEVGLTITEQTVTPSSFSTNIVGTVKNTSGDKVKFVHIDVVGIDQAGNLADYADTFATAKTLDPGDSSGFSASVGTYQIEKPVSYRLTAFAQKER